jgi:hypothetical protein
MFYMPAKAGINFIYDSFIAFLYGGFIALTNATRVLPAKFTHVIAKFTHVIAKFTHVIAKFTHVILSAAKDHPLFPIHLTSTPKVVLRYAQDDMKHGHGAWRMKHGAWAWSMAHGAWA